MLKTILPSNAFYGRGPQAGPMVILTDDSSAERNALELCWPQSIFLLNLLFIFIIYIQYKFKFDINLNSRYSTFMHVSHTSGILEMVI